MAAAGEDLLTGVEGGRVGVEHDHVGLGEAEPAHAGGRVEVLGPGEDGPIDGVVDVGVLQPPDVLAEGGRWCSAVIYFTIKIDCLAASQLCPGMVETGMVDSINN